MLNASLKTTEPTANVPQDLREIRSSTVTNSRQLLSQNAQWILSAAATRPALPSRARTLALSATDVESKLFAEPNNTELSATVLMDGEGTHRLAATNVS